MNKTLFEISVEKVFKRNTFYVNIAEYNDFIKALLQGDVEAMNEYINSVALSTFSSFDTGRKSSGKSQPERFYHGFALERA